MQSKLVIEEGTHCRMEHTYLGILSNLLLQPASGAMLGQLLHAQTSPSAVGPVPVTVAMRGAYDFTYSGTPGLDRKVFCMCIPRPLAFQHNLWRV